MGEKEILQAKQLLSSVIEFLAKEIKKGQYQGQWHDSLIAALSEARKSREHLEGIA